MVLDKVESPFGQFWSPVLAVSSPSNFLIPGLLSGGGRGVLGKEKALVLCKHYSAIATALLCHQHCFSHKPKTQHHMGCCEES